MLASLRWSLLATLGLQALVGVELLVWRVWLGALVTCPVALPADGERTQSAGPVSRGFACGPAPAGWGSILPRVVTKAALRIRGACGAAAGLRWAEAARRLRSEARVRRLAEHRGAACGGGLEVCGCCVRTEVRGVW